jgi:hypothetical protein
METKQALSLLYPLPYPEGEPVYVALCQRISQRSLPRPPSYWEDVFRTQVCGQECWAQISSACISRVRGYPSSLTPTWRRAGAHGVSPRRNPALVLV